LTLRAGDPNLPLEGGPMSEAGADKAIAKPRKDRSTLWWVLSLLLGLYMLEYDSEWLLRNMHLQPGLGQTGITRERPEPGAPPGFTEVRSILPGSVAERAGIMAGDFVRFPESGSINRTPAAGEAVPIIHERDGERRSLTLIADARPFGIEHAEWDEFIRDLALAVSVLFGLAIIVRSRGRPSALWLGVALAVFGAVSISPTFWTSGVPVFWFSSAFQWASYALLPVALLQFAMRFYTENVGPLGAGARRAFWAYTVAVFGSMVIVYWSLATSTALPIVGNGSLLSSIAVYVGLAAAGWALFVGWRASVQEVQQRYAIMLLGVGLILFSQVLQTTLFFLLNRPEGIWLTVSTLVSGLIAPALLAYAMLRHRVFDLGFAVNRTLVFSIVSGVLLLAFGLAEWVVNERLGIAVLRDNPLVAAAIALVLFLTFHHIHGAVERVVEGVFFRAWREREAALKRFVREAGFVLKGEVLQREYVVALRTYTDGAEAALYARDENGAYERREGVVSGAPEVIDADEPALVALRADHTQYEVAESRSTLPVALVLPMIIRHEIDGFVLLAAKPSGVAYRPDEKGDLAKATESIGDDLHALKLEQLQRGIANLEARNDELRAALNGIQAPKPA